MRKRYFVLLISLIFILNCVPAVNAAQAPEDSRQIERKTYPFYLNSTEETWPEEFPLYFVDGVDDLPFVEVNDWADVLNWYFPADGGESYADYRITVQIDEEKNQVFYLRDNGSFMIMDFNAGTILWDDYGKFLQPEDGVYMDLTRMKPRKDGQVNLIQTTAERVRYGESTILNLKDYNIPMIVQDGAYLLPLQTLSTFCLITVYHGMYFNRQCLILAEGMDMKVPADVMNEIMTLVTPEIMEQAASLASTPEEVQTIAVQLVAQTEEGQAIISMVQETYEKSLFKLYQTAEKGERSPQLAEFSYYELCLELDSLYGQKEEHNISDFNTFFMQTGLAVPLLTGDLQQAEDAIFSLAQGWLDDNHTRFLSRSYLAQDQTPGADALTGFSTLQLNQYVSQLGQIKAQYPEAVPWYYEVDDTAYLNLNQFFIDTDLDYYDAFEKGELPDPSADTISLVIQAHQKITRENSPIKNVVLDLSTNGGGSAPAAVYVLCWFLGESQVSLHNTFTNADSTNRYMADVNLDHQCDASDTISHLNLYCLTSPHSFSCGNLVPWAFKEDGRVTLIGKTTGGGACILYPVATAWGTTFTISGPSVISFMKNGSYYSVDKGAEPDYFIKDYEHFYDREALTEFIHGLY